MSWDLKYQAKPDFDYLARVIKGEEKGGPVPIIELAVDFEIMQEVCDEHFEIPKSLDFLSWDQEVSQEKLILGLKILDLSLKFAQTVGYDYVTALPIIPLPLTPMKPEEDTAPLGTTRFWQNEHKGMITSWQDLEKYPWPAKEQISPAAFDYLASKLPEGMKIISFIMGIFEAIKWLMGLENFAIACIKEPELVEELFERLTVVTEWAVDLSAGHPAVGAIFYAEDMGFKTQLMISPDLIRKWVIPRHKRIVQACHKHNKLFLFHSCGKIEAIIPDEIEQVGIDGWHSFQDAILPVEEAYKKYHDKVAILGGVDVDILARGTPQQVRKRTREILEVCGKDGRYCLGSGNSVTNFVPLENYRAMLEEGMRWNREVLGA